MATIPMFPLAVTTEMFWTDVPYLERVRRIHELGFQVEMWDWTIKDLDAVAALGATWSTMTATSVSASKSRWPNWRNAPPRPRVNWAAKNTCGRHRPRSSKKLGKY